MSVGSPLGEYPVCPKKESFKMGGGEINTFSLSSAGFFFPSSITNILQAAPELTPVTHTLHAIIGMGHTITHSDLVQHTT
mgnify:CR=1 FL=1